MVIAWVFFAMPALAEEWGIEVSNDSVAASIIPRHHVNLLHDGRALLIILRAP